MKKFGYFLLTAFTFLITSFSLHAFTTNSSLQAQAKYLDVVSLDAMGDVNLLAKSTALRSEMVGLQESAVSSTEIISNNLTLLYSICIALVLFNLVAQIKIIVQMVNLFFQFRKKDEFSGYNIR